MKRAARAADPQPRADSVGRGRERWGGRCALWRRDAAGCGGVRRGAAVREGPMLWRAALANFADWALRGAAGACALWECGGLVDMLPGPCEEPPLRRLFGSCLDPLPWQLFLRALVACRLVIWVYGLARAQRPLSGESSCQATVGP